MKIETKFNVNSLVKHKFTTQSKGQEHFLEVMEITSNTCYAGTQNFYICRSLHITDEVDFKDGKEIHSKSVVHSVGTEYNTLGWQKYREDELIEAPKYAINIIKHGKTI